MAAAVISNCPSSRRSKSHDNLDKITLGSERQDKTDHFVLELLSQLPPSRELLQHYQEKLEKYEREESQLMARVDACAKLLDNGRQLEAQITKNQAEVEGLKDDLEAVCLKLHEEKRINLKLASDNDKLRIKDVESQRKIKLLLSMCGKKDSEIVAMLDRKSPITDAEIKSYPKLKQLKEQSSYKQQKSSQSLELEVANLEQQLVDQERLHKVQLKEERLLWRKAEKFHVKDKNELREKVSQIQSTVASLENQIEIVTGQIIRQKNDHRKLENRWLNDKSVLMRKIEFFEKYGTMEGSHTDQRLKARLAGTKDKRGMDKLKKLENDLELKDREMIKSREEILHLKNEILNEKARSEAAANVLAKKTKAMTEKVNVLNDRCERVKINVFTRKIWYILFSGRKEKGSGDRGIPVRHQAAAGQAVAAGDQAAGGGRGERQGGGAQGDPRVSQAGACGS